jgi:hypothetical protein
MGSVEISDRPFSLLGTPGTQACVQVVAVPNYYVGSSTGGVSFAVTTMSSPQEA